MSNYYVLANEGRDKFLDAAGAWVERVDDAHQYNDFADAVMKHMELAKNGISTEVCEVPLMHEAFYADIDARLTPIMERLHAAGCTLSTQIGEGDETLWKFEFENAGLTLTVRLAGPDAWEMTDED